MSTLAVVLALIGVGLWASNVEGYPDLRLFFGNLFFFAIAATLAILIATGSIAA